MDAFSEYESKILEKTVAELGDIATLSVSDQVNLLQSTMDHLSHSGLIFDIILGTRATAAIPDDDNAHDSRDWRTEVFSSWEPEERRSVLSNSYVVLNLAGTPKGDVWWELEEVAYEHFIRKARRTLRTHELTELFVEFKDWRYGIANTILLHLSYQARHATSARAEELAKRQEHYQRLSNFSSLLQARRTRLSLSQHTAD